MTKNTLIIQEIPSVFEAQCHEPRTKSDHIIYLNRTTDHLQFTFYIDLKQMFKKVVYKR